MSHGPYSAPWLLFPNLPLCFMVHKLSPWSTCYFFTMVHLSITARNVGQWTQKKSKFLFLILNTFTVETHYRMNPNCLFTNLTVLIDTCSVFFPFYPYHFSSTYNASSFKVLFEIVNKIFVILKVQFIS